MTDRPTSLAVGGDRLVPTPDPIARDYLLLALRLDQRIPGMVDGYFGPADLKAQVDMEQLRRPADLAADAAALLERLDAEVPEPDRRAWLRAQLVALETHARALAGETLPYEETVARSFDARPQRRDEGVFAEAAAELEQLVPGQGDLRDRLAAWDDRLTIAPDRLPAVVDWLVERFRTRAASRFGLPTGESLRVSLVTGQPWSGYNWYDGGLRSRVDLNLDLPIRAPELVGVIAHETYSGHHLEHAWKEAELVEARGHLEASVLLLNTPECFVSEGIAEVGRRFVAPVAEEADLLAELFDRAGLALAVDSSAARDAAARAAAIRGPRSRLAAAAVDAALLRHADGLDHHEVRAWLERVALLTPARAEQRLKFIEHPLWRLHVFVYTEGAALLERWLDSAESTDDAAQAARFGRLLVEPLTPSAIAAEVARSSISAGRP